MKGRILRLGIFVSLIFSGVIQAQTGFDKGIQSPAAASLGTYAANPPNLYSGSINVSIPLVTLTSGEIVVPVTLQNSNTGYKVGEIPGWVGHGWNLQAGGVITRTVRGMYDEKQDYGFLETGDHLYKTADVDWDNQTANQDYVDDIYDGLVDTEPDIFYYNFQGYSGSFVFYVDQSGNPHIRLLEESPLSIDYNVTVNNKIDKFTIYDPSGKFYVFSDVESTTSETVVTDMGDAGNSSLVPDEEYNSSWYLSSITATNGQQKVFFNYTDYVGSTHDRIPSEEWIQQNNSSSGQNGRRIQTKDRHDFKLLSSIVSQNAASGVSGVQEIVFTVSNESQRTDFLKERHLDKLEYKLNGNTKEKYVFVYDSLGTGTNTSRLTLEEVKSFGTGEEEKPGWEFQYYTGGNFVKLNSQEVDFWGYHNCKTQNNSSGNVTPTIDGVWTGDNRDPNATCAKKGMLSKVIYPTGGETTFDYEGNDIKVVDPGGSELVSRNVSDGLDAISSSFSKTTNFSVGGSNSSVQVVSQTILPSATQPAECDDTDPGNDPPGCVDPGDLNPACEDATIKVKTSAGSLVEDLFQGSASFSLNTGNYKLVIERDDTDCELSTELDWQENIVTPPSESIEDVGGLRIKEIKDYDGVSHANDITKTYEYRLKSSSSSSSGYVARQMFHYMDMTIASKALRFISSTSLAPLGSGSNSAYKEVKETVESALNSGYTWHYFSVSGDSPPTNFLIGPYTDRNYSRGKLLKQEVYNSSNKLLKKIEHVYSYTGYTIDQISGQPLPAYRGLKLRNLGEVFTELSGGTTVNTHIGAGSAAYYTLEKSWEKPTSTKVTEYDPGSQSYNYNVLTLYSHDDSFHKQVTKKVETNSLTTEKRETIYEYAHETYDGVDGMDDRNMLTQLYSILVKDGSGHAISKTWTEWSLDFNVASDTSWKAWKNSVWKGSSLSDTTAPGVPTSEAVTISEVVAFDVLANPIEVKDDFNNTTKYYYGSNASPFSQSGLNGTKGVYLTGVQKIQGSSNCSNCGTRPSGVDDLFVEAEYDSYGQVTSVTDENSQVTSFEYDSFNRLVKTTSPGGGINKNNYFYSREPSGSYSSSAPNQVETVTGIDSYETDFSSSSGWAGFGGRTFNHTFDGTKTVRLGGNSGAWTSIYRSIGEENVHVKADVYPASSYAIENPYVLALDNGNYRFSIRYNPSTDKFYVFKKLNGNETAHTFSLDVPPNTWYTIELEKRGSLCMAWVYKKGKPRSSGQYFELDGFPTSWLPNVRTWSKDNYIYLADLEYVVNPQFSISYLDGLGRQIQTQVRAADKVITTETLYNDRGQPEVSSRPIETTSAEAPGYYDSGLMGGSSFTPGSSGTILPATSLVHNYYAPKVAIANDEDLAYSQVEYELSPLARVEKSTLPGISHKMGSGKEIKTRYGLNTTESFTINGKTWGTNKLNKTVIEDPDGNETITYTDGWGQTIVSGVNMNPSIDDVLNKSSSDLVTYFEYDIRGNLVRVEDPRGLITTYTYNILGQLIERKLPDQSYVHQYGYDKKGRLRVQIDPNITSANILYFTAYDELDRPVRIGEYNNASAFDTETLINDPDWPYQGSTDYVSYSYDETNQYSGANNTMGKISRTKYKDLNAANWGYTWYSYNSLGLVEWIVQRLPGQSSSLDKKIEYSYDELGRLTRVFFNPSGTTDDHYFWYYYDELGRMNKVSSYGSNAESSALTEAEYTYHADGQVEQLKLGGGAQVMDYDYTIQGWMEEINNGTTSGGDVFGMLLKYNDNGNINQQQWKQAAFSTGTYNYYYDYDSANRLSSACYDGASCNSGAFDVTYAYDKNGGLENITRYDETGTWTSYDHSYVSGTNKLDYVEVDGMSSATQTKNFSHDASGNVTENGVQGITSTTYDWRNLPKQVVTGTGTLKFAYDAGGNRVKKELVGNSTTWYVRGADGQTIAAYDASGNLLFLNIMAGGQVIGQIEN